MILNNEQTLAAWQRSLTCLRLEVPDIVWQDVKAKNDAALAVLVARVQQLETCRVVVQELADRGCLFGGGCNDCIRCRAIAALAGGAS